MNDEQDKILIDYGKRGEIYIFYIDNNMVEIWDWFPRFIEEKPENETLYLHGQYTIPANNSNEGDERILYDMRYLEEEPNSEISLLLFYNNSKNYVFEICNLIPESNEVSIKQVFPVPDYLLGQNCLQHINFKIKANKNFIVYGNQEGYSYILRFDTETRKFVPGNHHSSLNSFKTNTRNYLPKEINDMASENEVIFRTSNYEDMPIFDLVGNWLVYSPRKDEFKNNILDIGCDKISLDDFDPIIQTSQKKNHLTTREYTPVKLPPPGPLLNRLVSSFSSSALDGIFKISEASSNLVREYLNKEQKFRSLSPDDKEFNVILNSLGKTLGKILYSTASSTVSTLQRSAVNLKLHDNQHIKIIDLSNDLIIATFRAPGGVSNLSLSPFDSQLVHSSLRGDSFYIWDLHKLPHEVSLVGKFTRGKTSAIIRDIFWFINNHDHDITGNNLGFGCISNSGTVHWFNVNYLFGSLLNHPNILGKEKFEDSLKEQFKDSWILSSLNAKRFIKLPNVSNSNIGNKNIYFNQLAILDDKNQVKLLSSLNGNHQYKYVIPDQPILTNIEYSKPARNTIEQNANIHPLSQTEIETCAPYLNLINNRNITFSTYNLNQEGSMVDGLKYNYEYFGNAIPTNLIKFPNNNYEHEIKCFDDSLTCKFQGILIDEATY